MLTRQRYVQVHPLTYLAKLNIEMNMAELIAKVVKRSGQRAEIPTAEVYQTQLRGVDPFDRNHEWLGSAKDIIMPHDHDPGQMDDLNTEVLSGSTAVRPPSPRADEASSSTDAEEIERRRVRAGSSQNHRKDSGTSWFNGLSGNSTV